MKIYSRPLGAAFEHVPVRLLKEYKGGRNIKFKIGSEQYLQRVPGGQAYLMGGINALEIDPEEGIDFEFI